MNCNIGPNGCQVPQEDRLIYKYVKHAISFYKMYWYHVKAQMRYAHMLTYVFKKNDTQQIFLKVRISVECAFGYELILDFSMW